MWQSSAAMMIVTYQWCCGMCKKATQPWHWYTYTATGKPNYENGFISRFTLSRKNMTEGNLTISKLIHSDSAVYYCAARQHSAVYSHKYIIKTSNTLKHKCNIHFNLRFLFNLMRFFITTWCFISKRLSYTDDYSSIYNSSKQIPVKCKGCGLVVSTGANTN